VDQVEAKLGDVASARDDTRSDVLEANAGNTSNISTVKELDHQSHAGWVDASHHP
jgi:hypothetical protein